MDLQQIVEFIEMNRVLGAEIITMYVMEMKEDALQFLLRHYSKHGLLQLVKWKKLQRWDPLHYVGQILTVLGLLVGMQCNMNCDLIITI